MKFLVTGSAGFIGSSLVLRLLQRGDEVVGLDSINDYYDVRLKYWRLNNAGISKKQIAYNTFVQSFKFPNYRFIQLNLEDKENLIKIFKEEGFDKICNLAAQAGVRYSLINPNAYIQSNIIGFLNILEACRKFAISHLVYASSSSVYGLNTKMPFSVSDNVDHPISLYAASKKSNELMAHTYSHLFALPTTGLRFFTVYGPWGRPDMALFLFANAMMKGNAIEVFNNGEMLRDFTYIDDIVEGIVRVLDKNPVSDKLWNGENPNPSSSKAPYRIYNIGNNTPVKLMDFITILEKELGVKAKKNMLPIQKGDVIATYADIKDLEREFGYKPNTSVEKGIKEFVIWYKEFLKISEQNNF